MSAYDKLPKRMDNGIRIDGYNDMAQVFDPYKNVWVNWEKTGVIDLPSTITITTTTLEGQPAICEIGDYSSTVLFVNGVAVFTGIFEVGTATITCGEFSVEVEVPATGGQYSGVLEEEVELIIFENGAGKNGGDYSQWHSVASNNWSMKYSGGTGFLVDKDIKLATKKTGSPVSIYFRCYSDSFVNGMTSVFLRPNGVVGGELYGYYETEEYRYKASDIATHLSNNGYKVEKVHSILWFCNVQNAGFRAFDSYISKIALV
jgi:hypothetical protein